MGDPKNDPTPRARETADAELARQDKVAADQLALSRLNLRTMAAALGEEHYGDASVGLTRVARQQHDEAAPYAEQGARYDEASIQWGATRISIENQATELGQSYVATAEHRRAKAAADQPSEDESERERAQLDEAETEARMRGHAAKAEMWGTVASTATENAIEAEEHARAIHPEAAAEIVAPEPSVSE